MTKLNKAERKQRLREFKQNERTAFEDSMPIPPATFLALLECLDAELDACDHSTAATERFLRSQGIDPQAVLPWLREHGGYCDCEVLHNLYDLAEPFREPPPRRVARTRLERPPRSLHVVPGWNLERLPKPWRIANRHVDSEPLAIQLGKRDGCRIAIIESPLPTGDPSSDQYWVDLWYQRTELPAKSVPTVARATLELPDHLQSVLVSTGSWLPVYCWIIAQHGDWYLEASTDTRRQRSDLPQIAALIRQLESRKP